MAAKAQKILNPVLEEKFSLILQSIKLFPSQVNQAWGDIDALSLPENFSDIQNVIVAGMGGSALGARAVDSLIVDRVRVPLEVFTEYKLPNYANEKTLVVISSYSGSTEETISCIYDAINRNCKIFGITTGGKLSEILTGENLPRYIFEPKNNPSKQPRMAVGYPLGALLALFSKINLITLSREDLDGAISKMQEVISDCDENSSLPDNLAKSYAKKIYGKIPVLVASEHLVGTAHSIKNMLNESAKTFSILFDLPELNHHLMEGLRYPLENKKILYFIFFNSNLYSENVKKRYPLTSEVVGKNGIEYSLYSPFADTKISQVFSTYVFGEFLVYYLSRQYSVDPLEIPWVDYFKAQLANK